MKKKVLLVAAIFTAAFFANEAQAQDFKPAAGDKTIEVNFTPFGGSPVSINGLKFRSFTSETSAFRLGINIGYSRINQAMDTVNISGTTFEMVDHNSVFNINLEPGVEKHFAGTDRLSPYVGAVATIGYTRSTKVDEKAGNVAPSTSTTPKFDVYKVKEINNGANDGLSLGLRAVMGADWYFTQKMYLGIEVGYGLMYTSLATTKIKVKDTDWTDAQLKAEESETERGSNFQIGATFNSALRLGYAF